MFGGKLDVPKQAAQKGISARERFQNLDRRASETQSTDKDLSTLHKNSIRCVPAQFEGLCSSALECGQFFQSDQTTQKWKYFNMTKWILGRPVCVPSRRLMALVGTLKLYFYAKMLTVRKREVEKTPENRLKFPICTASRAKMHLLVLGGNLETVKNSKS